MAFAYRRDEKIMALQGWVNSLQAKIDVIKENLDAADVLDRWEGVEDTTRNNAFQSAYDELIDLAHRIERYNAYCVRYHVSPDNYNRAKCLIDEKAELFPCDGKSLTVPLWAAERSEKALKLAGIRFKKESPV